MKKKLFSLLTALLLCLLCAVPAFAEMPLVMDTYTHTTETETYDPVKDDSSSSGRVPTATVLAAAPAENSKSIHFDNSGGFLCESAAGLLSEFFVMTLRNVLLFRGAANTKKLLQRLIHAAGVFFTFSFSARTP